MNSGHLKNNLRFDTVLKFLAALALVSLMLISCRMGVKTRALVGGKLEIAVEVARDANMNSPVAVELVVIYDDKLMEQLMTMSAKNWFQAKKQIKKDYLEGEGFDSWLWEWVPGQEVPIQKLPLKARAEGAVMFAGYLSPGDHRSKIDPFKNVTVRLLEKDFAVFYEED